MANTWTSFPKQGKANGGNKPAIQLPKTKPATKAAPKLNKGCKSCGK